MWPGNQDIPAAGREGDGRWDMQPIFGSQPPEPPHFSLLLREDHNIALVPGHSQSSWKGNLVVLWGTLSEIPHHRQCHDGKKVLIFFLFLCASKRFQLTKGFCCCCRLFFNFLPTIVNESKGKEVSSGYRMYLLAFCTGVSIKSLSSTYAYP